MLLSELRTGQRFHFPEAPRTWYVSRGNCWYGSLAGYDGGPWHIEDREVVPEDAVSEQWEAHLRYVGNE